MYMRMEETHIEPFVSRLIHIADTTWKGEKGNLAKKAKISGGYLSEILNRKKAPSKKVAHSLAGACGYAYSDFIQEGIYIKDSGDTLSQPRTKGSDAKLIDKLMILIEKQEKLIDQQAATIEELKREPQNLQQPQALSGASGY